METQGARNTDLPTMALHWAVTVCLLVSILTGLRIAADSPDAQWAQALSGVLPQGDVIELHAWTALGLAFFSVAYLAFLWRTRLFSRIALDGTRLRALFFGTGAERRQAFNVSVYWLAFLGLSIAAITGVALYFGPWALPYTALTDLHQVAAWGLVAYVFIHIAALLALGGMAHLLKIFKPRLAYGPAAAIALVVGAGAAAAFWGMDRASTTRLTIAPLSQAPTLDGIGSDAVWDEANSVAIATHRGENLPDGEVTVTLRAGRYGDDFYSLFQWPDTTRSQKHLPLVKTEAGWRVRQTEFGIQDEDAYYEDKFGVMLATGGGLAGDGSIHMGAKPLDHKPGPSGGRGLHYTTDGGIVDVWHWKSVRTGNPVMNQIDDNFFGPPMKPKSKGRYTGGYSKDAKTGGGFVMNWEVYSDGIVTPKRLPRNPALAARFQDVDLDPAQSDDVALFLPLHETVPYDSALDTYPVGTILPAVLVDAPFEGDRGDVSAYARWADGLWTLEVRRKLDTGSAVDIAIKPGAPVYLWVAVFDHTQTRHSQHLHPIKLELEG